MDNNYNDDCVYKGMHLEEIVYSMLQELPAPVSFEKILESQPARGFINPVYLKHSYVKDGLMVRGADLNDRSNFDLFRILLNESLATINKVEDEHLKSLGMISAGFLRFIEIEFKQNSKSNTPWDSIIIRLFFRFTTDLCPAGLRMLRRTRALLEELYTDKTHLGIKRLMLECYHAGTAWNLEDVNDEAQRLMLSEVLSIIQQDEIPLIPITFKYNDR